MNIQELATSSHHAIPIVAVVMNDRHLGMIRQLQDAFYNQKHVECTFPPDVDYVGLARAMGLDGTRVTDIGQVGEAIDKGLSSDRTFVVECIIESQENIPYQSYDE